MKHVTRLSICLCLTISFICSFQHVMGKEGDADARGGFNSVKNGDVEIIVSGWTDKGPLWLGCTVIHESGREQDLKAKREGKCLIFCSGKFEEEFKMPVNLMRGEFEIDYVVALWRWKIDKSECRKGENRKPCQWCRQNGYHLEGKVRSTVGTWKHWVKGFGK